MNIPSGSKAFGRLRRLEEASQWLQRMQDPQRSDEQMNEWLHWIDTHPDNFAEFERLQRDWEEYSLLKADVVPPTALHGLSSGALEKSDQSAQQFRPGGRRAQRTAAWGVAAGLAVIAVGFGLHQRAFLLKEAAPATPRQVTAASINRSATLPDGSKMVLGTQSRVDVDFKHQRRELNLSAGEAYFKVKHDRTRPFVVQAGNISVTAIGTAFDVRRGDGTITVTVEEGIVEVAAASLTNGAAQADPVTWRAEAGSQLTYSISSATASITAVNPVAEFAWRQGDLAYVREPLGSVVDDLNRYWRARIVIEDPQVADLQFTGTVFVASLTDWLAGIEQAYPVTAWHAKNGEVALRWRR